LDQVGDDVAVIFDPPPRRIGGEVHVAPEMERAWMIFLGVVPG
jgi:hypothetical protein